MGLFVLGGMDRSAERDPMFAEETVQPTIPPELLPDEGEDTHTDHSADWVITDRAPVEKTAEQLAEEAQAAEAG